MTRKVILKGVPASPGEVAGKVRIIMQPADVSKLRENEILVAPFTSPLFTSAILKASAIITNEGGVMSHGAIVARERAIPCVTGTKKATEILNDNQQIVVNGDEGIVYER